MALTWKFSSWHRNSNSISLHLTYKHFLFNLNRLTKWEKIYRLKLIIKRSVMTFTLTLCKVTARHYPKAMFNLSISLKRISRDYICSYKGLIFDLIWHWHLIYKHHLRSLHTLLSKASCGSCMSQIGAKIGITGKHICSERLLHDPIWPWPTNFIQGYCTPFDHRHYGRKVSASLNWTNEREDMLQTRISLLILLWP